MGVEALALPNYVLFMALCAAVLVASTRLIRRRETQLLVATVLMWWAGLSIGGWFVYLAYEDPTFSTVSPVFAGTLLGSLAALWTVRRLSAHALQ